MQFWIGFIISSVDFLINRYMITAFFLQASILKVVFFSLAEKTRKEMTSKGSTGIEVILSTLEVKPFNLCG